MLLSKSLQELMSLAGWSLQMVVQLSSYHQSNLIADMSTLHSTIFLDTIHLNESLIIL